MIKGLYSAASGMINLLNANDNIANSLANVNTPGFKQGVTVFKTFAPLLMEKISSTGEDGSGTPIGSISSGSGLQAIQTDFTAGQILDTDRDLDLAIQGDGFFQVQKDNGEMAYTRNGCFQISQEGYLVTREGYKVIGNEDKPIMVGKEFHSFEVNNEGEITVDRDLSSNSDDELVNKIKLVEFDNLNSLAKEGNTLFVDTGNAGPKVSEASQIIQGALEGSNANAIKTMVKSIEGMRAYETLAKIVETTNKNLEKTAGELGRV